MTRYLIAAALILLAGYGLFEAQPLLAGPSLSITSPLDDAVFPGAIVSVTGTVARASSLSLDGNPLPSDRDGHFAASLTFPKGTSILTFVATDRFGRTITKTRTIFVP